MQIKQFHAKKTHATEWLMIPLAFVISYALSSIFNWSEQYNAWSAMHESTFNIDELPIALIATITASFYFLYTRYQQINRLLDLNHQLIHHANTLQENERKKLAMDLHDELGQYLNAIKIESYQIKHMPNIDEESKNTANNIQAHANHAYQIVKNMIYAIRPIALDDLGLKDALINLVTIWQNTSSQRPDATKYQINIHHDIEHLHDDLKLDVYRIVQEALTNASKHAYAKHISVDLSCKDQMLQLSIQDDGIGINKQQQKLGFGLMGIEERVKYHHGTFIINTSPKGTTIEIEMQESS